MTNWEDMFLIEGRNHRWLLYMKDTTQDMHKGKFVGEYMTYHYAVNRAKFYFKKEMRKIEKLLLSR